MIIDMIDRNLRCLAFSIGEAVKMALIDKLPSPVVSVLDTGQLVDEGIQEGRLSGSCLADNKECIVFSESVFTTLVEEKWQNWVFGGTGDNLLAIFGVWFWWGDQKFYLFENSITSRSSELGVEKFNNFLSRKLLIHQLAYLVNVLGRKLGILIRISFFFFLILAWCFILSLFLSWWLSFFFFLILFWCCFRRCLSPCFLDHSLLSQILLNIPNNLEWYMSRDFLPCIFLDSHQIFNSVVFLIDQILGPQIPLLVGFCAKDLVYEGLDWMLIHFL